MSKISKEKITVIDNDLPGLLRFDKSAPARVEFPNFQWEGKKLKKVTKFRYFLAGIELWWLLLKEKHGK